MLGGGHTLRYLFLHLNSMKLQLATPMKGEDPGGAQRAHAPTFYLKALMPTIGGKHVPEIFTCI